MLQGSLTVGVSYMPSGLAHSDPWPRVSPCRLIRQVSSPAAMWSGSRHPDGDSRPRRRRLALGWWHEGKGVGWCYLYPSDSLRGFPSSGLGSYGSDCGGMRFKAKGAMRTVCITVSLKWTRIVWVIRQGDRFLNKIPVKPSGARKSWDRCLHTYMLLHLSNTKYTLSNFEQRKTLVCHVSEYIRWSCQQLYCVEKV